MPFPAEYGSKPYQFIPSPNDNYTLASEGPLARSSKAGNEITSICFDSSHELFWTGNASGRVSGFTTDTMKQVFTFNESRSYIQNLDIYDDIVITVTSNSVAGFQRSGHAFFRAHLPCFQDLKCIHRPSTNQNTVFIGGKQNDLIIFDLESQTDVKIISDENSSASQIRSNHSNIFCSNDKGVITIRSHNGEKLSEIQAHYGPITGFDICDNKLVTAGCTIKSGYNDPFGTPRGDPFLKVYDLRYMTAMQPISTPFPPQHVFFADSLNTGKIVLTSHFGRVWTTNINNNSSTNFIHELPIYAHIQHAALSSSHQTLAVVDNQQYGHIYSMYSPVRGCYGVVNYNSRSLTSSSYQPYDGYYDGMNSRDTMSSSPANCQNYYNNSTAFNDGTYGMQNLNVSGSSGSYGHQPPKSRTNPDAAFVLRNAVKGPIPVYSAEFFNGKNFFLKII
jgi:hypothetical protein